MYQMSTTVRIREEDKARLDRLQAKLALARDRRMSLDEVLHQVIAVAERHEEDLLKHDRGPQLSEERIQEILEMPRDWGVETDSSRLDEDLAEHYLR